MKKKLLALLIGLSISGATVGGAVYSYAEENKAQLSIADDAAEEEDTQKADDTEETEAAGGQIGSVTLLSSETDETPAFSYSNVADVAEADMPSIVSITNTSVQQVQDWFSRRTYEYPSESVGTGIILGENDTELLITTNNHVVADSDTLTVTFVDGESYEAQVKGTDAADDLAVVAVNLEDISEDTRSQIKIAKVGNSDEMRIGEQVVAIGNALGYGQSVTTGIISAKDRSIQVADDSTGRNVTTYDDLLQIDAAINPGNSGGALLNMSGEVIGINSAKASESGVEGMGYAIPISKAMPILENLMSKETRTKLDQDEMGYMGINGEGVSSEATQLYGVPAGVYITQVGSGTPAEKAGLEEGNILTAFDGTPVSTMSDLQEQLQYYKAGETVDLTIQTNKGGAYTEETVSITLGERPVTQQ